MIILEFPSMERMTEWNFSSDCLELAPQVVSKVCGSAPVLCLNEWEHGQPPLYQIEELFWLAAEICTETDYRPG